MIYHTLPKPVNYCRVRKNNGTCASKRRQVFYRRTFLNFYSAAVKLREICLKMRNWNYSEIIQELFSETPSRKHTYIILTPLNPTFIK